MASEEKGSRIRIIRATEQSPSLVSKKILEVNQNFRDIGKLVKLAMLTRRNNATEHFDQFKALDTFLQEARANGIGICENSRIEYGIDCEALLTTDYLGMAAPIVIETKYTFDEYSLYYRISKDVYSYIVKGNIASAIFIIHDSLKNVDIEALQSWMDDRFEGIFTVKIILTEDIMGIKIDPAINRFILGLTNDYYDKVTDLDYEEYNKFYKGRIERLQSDLEKRKIAVFFGAGISSSMGFPTWARLIENLWQETARGRGRFEKADDNYVNEKLGEIIGDSSLIKARMLQAEYGETLMWRLRDLLYPKSSKMSDLLSVSCNLIRDLNKSGKLSQILTLNYDDTVEKRLEEIGIHAKPIYGTDNSYEEELYVFHVHGFLPPKPQKLTDKEINSIVFSETAYNMLASDSYASTNLRVLQRFVEDSCLFIGHSMTDPNIRRLLEVSQNMRKGVRHHWFKRIDDVERDNRDKYIFSLRIGRLQEYMMNTLGVNVIWYREHDELPLLIQSVREAIAK